MTSPFTSYFKAIKEFDSSEATEHTLRTALGNLLNASVAHESLKIKVIHEPKRDRTGLGAPDFKFKLHEAIVGYLENKKIGEDLDIVLKTDQIAKYKKLSGNIILTDYLEWIWLKDGHIIKRETLCYRNDVGHHKAKLDQDKATKVAELLAGFLSMPPKKLGEAKKLSVALAVRCHDLRDFLLEELERQDKEHQAGRLRGLYAAFQKDLFHELELKEFADAFAQTLGYGLFLAKLNAKAQTKVTLQNAKNYIPANFALIRELVNFLDELEQDEYRGIKWLVEEILTILNTLDLAAIHEDLAFTKRQARLSRATEEERLLFAKDPYVYFYEDFLKAYDKDTRKARGVYYTPPPVVHFIVRAVHDILKDVFGIRQGLADRRRVTVLDFATGTGTFLLEVLHRIFETVSPGVRTQVIQEHVLKNLYGFEYLIAPYTVAHLKLSQFLHDQGYVMLPGERLNIYLTNTLEPIQPATVNYLLPALSKEVRAAQIIKDKPVLVITGNPPYSGHSKNKGKWITGLIDTYKEGFPELNKPGQGKWLHDDYVKFIRFAQWKMEQVEEGVVGIITNHSFLDNPTFRGMRSSLMHTFNQMYLMDLHGNTKKKERTPEGGKDENVFDIEQGVAISLLVKKKGLQKKICRADLWGRRKEKYVSCLERDIGSVEWKTLHPTDPYYLFVERDAELEKSYYVLSSLPEIFGRTGNPAPGIVTTHDEFAISYTPEESVSKVEQLIATKNEQEARRYFRLCKQSQWNYTKAKEELGKSGWREEIVPVLYRPFDQRWTVFDSNVAVHRRERVTSHMLAGENLGLCASRGKETGGGWEHVFCCNQIIQHHTVSLKEVNYLFPLYLYPPPEKGKQESNDTLYEASDPIHGKERIENLREEFRAFIDKKYKHRYSPEDILGYIYAVLHSPTYREKYQDFLKIDFPRVPFVSRRKTFEALSTLGWKLMQAHLLKSIPQGLNVDVTPGNFTVEKSVYDAQRERRISTRRSIFPPCLRMCGNSTSAAIRC